MKFLTLLFLSFLSLACFGADGYLARTNGNIVIGPGGSAGSQTPLAQDVNGAGFSITNLGSITATNVTTSTNNIGTIILTNYLTPDTLSTTSSITDGMALTYDHGTNKFASVTITGVVTNGDTRNLGFGGTLTNAGITTTGSTGGLIILSGTGSGSIVLSNSTAITLIQFGPDDYWFMTNTTTTKKIVATNGNITAFSFTGDGSGLTGLPAGSESATNGWVTNTAFPVNPSQSITNLILVSGANTACGVTGILNAGTSTERFGQLLIIASGNITFTNPASIHASDYVTTRVITNGNNAMIAFDVWPGLATNMFISQTK